MIARRDICTEICKFLSKTQHADNGYLHDIIEKYRKKVLWIINNINNLDTHTINNIVMLSNKQDSSVVNSWYDFNNSSLTDDIFEYFFYHEVRHDDSTTHHDQLSAIHDAWAMSKIFQFYRDDKTGMIRIKMGIERDNKPLLTFYFTSRLYMQVRKNRVDQFVHFTDLDEKEKEKDVPFLNMLRNL